MVLGHDELTLQDGGNHGIAKLNFIQGASLHTTVGVFKVVQLIRDVLPPVDVVLEILGERHRCRESQTPHVWTLEQNRKIRFVIFSPGLLGLNAS